MAFGKNYEKALFSLNFDVLVFFDCLLVHIKVFTDILFLIKILTALFNVSGRVPGMMPSSPHLHLPCTGSVLWYCTGTSTTVHTIMWKRDSFKLEVEGIIILLYLLPNNDEKQMLTC